MTKVVDIISNVRTHEVDLSRQHQPHQRRPMCLACHHLETIRQEKCICGNQSNWYSFRIVNVYIFPVVFVSKAGYRLYLCTHASKSISVQCNFTIAEMTFVSDHCIFTSELLYTFV